MNASELLLQYYADLAEALAKLGDQPEKLVLSSTEYFEIEFSHSAKMLFSSPDLVPKLLGLYPITVEPFLSAHEFVYSQVVLNFPVDALWGKCKGTGYFSSAALKEVILLRAHSWMDANLPDRQIHAVDHDYLIAEQTVRVVITLKPKPLLPFTTVSSTLNEWPFLPTSSSLIGAKPAEGS